MTVCMSVCITVSNGGHVLGEVSVMSECRNVVVIIMFPVYGE